MPRYLVLSGGMERTVEAADMDKAFNEAVRQEAESEKPAKLGLITSAIEVVGEEYFISTETLCRRIGRWVEATA